MSADGEDVVSVVVTTRNSDQKLEACLASVRGQSHPRVELVVVDNGSTDNTLEIARRYAHRVDTAGPERSAQRNFGASVAAGDYLMFVDSDMVLSPDVVAEGLTAMRRTSLPAVIVPEVSVGDGFWSRCRILERSCYDGDDSIEAARIFERSAFTQAGGFDLQLTGAEDWDLSRRVARGRSLPRTAASLLHDEGHIRLRSAFQKRRYYAPGYLRYLRKHGSDVASQGNPILRAAYVRNWRALAKHPVLTAGMIGLKAVESAAILQVALEQKVRPERATHAVDVYRPSAARERAAQPRPLLITFGSVLKPDGGLAVRSRVLAETLTGLGASPTVLSTREPEPGPLSPPWARSLEVPRTKPKRGFSWELVRLIRKTAADADVIIIANAMFMPALVMARVRQPVVWDTNECQTLHYARLPATPSNRLKYAAWWLLERWAASRSRVAVAIGENEASEWRRIHSTLRDKVATVDHGPFAAPRAAAAARSELERVLGGTPDGPVLVFVGTMRAKHNAAAGRWLVDVLAPRLPLTTTIVLCGPGSERFQSGGRGARVAALGAVEDVDSIIAAADLCLAPLASGAGVKTKVLHYLAHGRRVAGTPVAFEGLDGAPGLFAATLDEMPALVATLTAEAESDAAAQTRSADQRNWFEWHHGREHIADQWKEILRCVQAA
jgi:hypothetical protein